MTEQEYVFAERYLRNNFGKASKQYKWFILMRDEIYRLKEELKKPKTSKKGKESLPEK